MKFRVGFEPGFVDGLKQLPPDRREAARRGLVKFGNSPELPSLKFRALEGRSGYFIINPRRGDRIVLRKVAECEFVAVDVGPHDNVYRRWNRLR